MSVHASHAALPYPIKGCRFSFIVPFLDADGDPTDPTTPDTEISKDGAAAADCTEEVSAISGMAGAQLMTLTGDELNCSIAALNAKSASGPKFSIMIFQPRVLPVLRNGTAQGGAAGAITLDSSASSIDDYYNGLFVRTTGGTGGGGGSGSLGNQCRVVTDYSGSSKSCTVVPNWETNPDATTTFELLIPIGHPLFSLADTRAFGGTASTQSGGRPEVNTTHVAGSAILQSGGRIEANVTRWAGTTNTSTVPATPAEVNAEVVDALGVDTFTELAAVPAATATLKDMIRWMYVLARNKITQTSSLQTVRDDTDTGTIAQSSVSEVGGTATRGKFT